MASKWERKCTSSPEEKYAKTLIVKTALLVRLLPHVDKIGNTQTTTVCFLKAKETVGRDTWNVIRWIFPAGSCWPTGNVQYTQLTENYTFFCIRKQMVDVCVCSAWEDLGETLRDLLGRNADESFINSVHFKTCFFIFFRKLCLESEICSPCCQKKGVLENCPPFCFVFFFSKKM